jgi:alpha-tubulin suppressor-like RCC1 family protein
VNSLFTKFARLALALTVGGLLLTACGAGPNEVANPPRPAGAATVTAVVSPPRVVAGQIYTYQAAAPSGATVTWSWGDGSPDSVGTTVQKVWNKSGSQTVSLSANANGKTAAVTQTVAVAGEPVSTGANHSCALQPAGTVLCWGANTQGQLGDGTQNARTTSALVTAITNAVVSDLSDAIALSSGSTYTCALKANGSVACWGFSNGGLLADGAVTLATRAVAVNGVADAVAISAGSAHRCALKANGSVACWGDNSQGQIGDGTTTPAINAATTVSGLTDAIAISLGNNHTCALKADRTVACWGSNDSGQLGVGPNANSNIRATPTQVIGLTDAVALSAGFNHTCALKADGSAACWGNNTSGEVGDGTTVTKVITTAVTGLTDAVAISAGGSANASTAGNLYRGRTCALKANGSAVCWGDKGYAASGSGQVQAIPTAFAGLTDTAAISMGGDHTCALKASGAVACWGNNSVAQIGNGTVGGVQTSLVQVITPNGPLTDVLSVSTGSRHTCAVKNDKTVACWGDNSEGQLGNSINTGINLNLSNPTPTTVIGLTDVNAVTTGLDYSCAVKTDNTVACWGSNFSGALGSAVNLVTFNSNPTPTLIAGLVDVAALNSSYGHNCALKKDSTVVCWGSNLRGQLGNGINVNVVNQPNATPTLVVGLTDVAAVSVSGGHTCAVKKDNTVECWGWNRYGQLGSVTNAGTDTANPTPSLVAGLTDATAVTAGTQHTCAVKKDSTVVCWGNNNNGQLGSSNNTGTDTINITPILIAGLTDVARVVIDRGQQTCAIKIDETVVCWGQRFVSQNGNGSTQINLPTEVPDLAGVVGLAMTGSHICGLNSIGVVCLGENRSGQLGGSATINTGIKLRPTAVLGGNIFWR